MEDQTPTFTIGHHESRRQVPITADLISQAHNASVCLPSPSAPFANYSSTTW